MKKRPFYFVVTFLVSLSMCLSGCQPTATKTAETPSFIPATATGDAGKESITPYQDARNLDFSHLAVNPDQALIKTLWFNESTKWPQLSTKIAQDILQKGMNPGLGIRSIHKQGITGKGIKVAIIDQNMVLDHPEFRGKIVQYYDVGTKQPANQGSMHAPAVTSLLVGENIGTAPGALVYFVAAPSWTADAQYQADALNWIIDQNEKLPQGDKIRIVSISAAPSGKGSPFTKNNDSWEAAYQRAGQTGLLVLDCTSHHGITAPCYYDLDDPDNVGKCIPGWPGIEDSQVETDRILIPISLRTTAEEYEQGVFSYQYTGRGGMSWSIPYLTGVLALGLQVNPNLTNSQLLDILYKSAYVTENGLKIINPVSFIEMVKQTQKQ